MVHEPAAELRSDHVADAVDDQQAAGNLHEFMGFRLVVGVRDVERVDREQHRAECEHAEQDGGGAARGEDNHGGRHGDADGARQRHHVAPVDAV